MSDSIRLGIAGLGTVGVGVIRSIRQKAALLRTRTGREITISAVCARSNKDRGINLGDYAWESDPVALASRDDIDVFVELIGGTEGPAKASTEAALRSGKDVVTANKAMLAEHGHALALLAENNGQVLRFEAAVAGGIPAVKALTEGLVGNEITRITGVMNGSCNHILTRMESAGFRYEDVFAEAKSLGYLEADPQLDVGGIDAAHKLSLLAAIAFGTQVKFDGVRLEGIEDVTIDDIRHAGSLGYKIKLLGIAQMTSRGLIQSMSPCLVPATSPLGQLDGSTNMVVLEGDDVGQIVLRGAGAGQEPTASAVISDIVDIARGLRLPTFGQPARTLTTAATAQGGVPAPYYLRLTLQDKPGTLAKVAKVLSEEGVSIHRMHQNDHHSDTTSVLIVTHTTSQSSLEAALSQMPGTGVVMEQPVAFRIEDV